VPLQKIAPLLVTLMSREVAIEEVPAMHEEANNSRPVAFTCPDCGGALRKVELGSIKQFACHIGHRMTSDALAEMQISKMDETAQILIRQLHERVEFCRQMSEANALAGDSAGARGWEAAASDVQQRLDAVRPVVEREWMAGPTLDRA
jgi:two-component system chemotaxis response regulator CheB